MELPDDKEAIQRIHENMNRLEAAMESLERLLADENGWRAELGESRRGP